MEASHSVRGMEPDKVVRGMEPDKVRHIARAMAELDQAVDYLVMTTDQLPEMLSPVLAAEPRGSLPAVVSEASGVPYADTLDAVTRKVQSVSERIDELKRRCEL